MAERPLSQTLNGTFVSQMFKQSTRILGIGIVFILIMLILPLPAFMLDFLMLINISLGLIIVISAVNVNRALDFSIFPSLLMFTTLFRIAINVSSTRLILTEGSAFGGNVVRTFADFVVGGNFVVGIIIFIALTVFQLIVITKGSTRVAEVTARFTLDAMNNKSMAIDADLQSGLITEREAIERRTELNTESAFYGSMDGASKYVSGDVKFGVFLTSINIIGGLIVGIIIENQPAGQALETYLMLAVGDGLVAQIPSILIAVAMGIIVTRTPSSESLGLEVSEQIFGNSATLYMAGIFSAGLLFIPGFPKPVLILISAFLFFIGYNINRLNTKAEHEEEKEAAEEKVEKEESSYDPDTLIDEVKVEPIEIELGYALVPLVDKSSGGDLLERIKKQRLEFVRELGLVVPQVRITDNTALDADEYVLKINGAPVGSHHIKVDRLLAINTSGSTEVLDAQKTTDPAFGLPSYWIGPDERDAAENKGYMIADGQVVLSTHLKETIRKNAAELVDRKMVRKILDSVRKRNSAVADEFEKNAKISLLQAVLKELISEQIPIKNIERILEITTDYSGAGEELISENIRKVLKRTISSLHADEGRNLNAVILSGEVTEELENQVTEAGGHYFISIASQVLRQLYDSFEAKLTSVREQGYHETLLVTSETLRKPLYKLLSPRFPQISVMSETEIAEGYKLNVVEKL